MLGHSRSQARKTPESTPLTMLISYCPASAVPTNLAPPKGPGPTKKARNLSPHGVGDPGPYPGQKHERTGGMWGPGHVLCPGLYDHSCIP